MQKVAIFSQQLKKDLDLSLVKIYPSSELVYCKHSREVKKLVEEAIVNEVIIDFDVANMEQVELVEWLKFQLIEGLTYHFLTDLNLEGEEKIIVPLNHTKVEEFIKKIMPIRHEIKNMFIKIPILKVSDLDFIQYSHYDEQGLFFNSHEVLDKDSLPINLSLTIEEDSKENINCSGHWIEVEKNDEDTGNVFYYKLILDEDSKVSLKNYFEHYDKLNTFVSEWNEIEVSNNKKG